MAPKKSRKDMEDKKRKTNNAVSETWEEWAVAAKRLGVSSQSIHRREKLLSGSEITEEQYLLLKFVWETDLSTDRAVNDLNLGQYYHRATNWLAAFTPFQRFVDDIENRTLG
jgi:hypothetical protein